MSSLCDLIFIFSLLFIVSSETVVWKCSIKKRVLRNFAKFTGKHLCQRVFFNKDSLAHVFSCEFWEIYENTFFTELSPHLNRRTYFLCIL